MTDIIEAGRKRRAPRIRKRIPKPRNLEGEEDEQIDVDDERVYDGPGLEKND